MDFSTCTKQKESGNADLFLAGTTKEALNGEKECYKILKSQKSTSVPFIFTIFAN